MDDDRRQDGGCGVGCEGSQEREEVENRAEDGVGGRGRWEGLAGPFGWELVGVEEGLKELDPSEEDSVLVEGVLVAHHDEPLAGVQEAGGFGERGESSRWEEGSVVGLVWCEGGVDEDCINQGESVMGV